MAEARERMTLRAALMLVAALAAALALARLPIVWILLDSRRIGPAAAGLRYAWLWTGLTLVVLFIRSPARRLHGSGWVLLGSLAFPAFLPSRSVAFEPDYAAAFNLGTFLAALALLISGWVWLLGSCLVRVVRGGRPAGAAVAEGRPAASTPAPSTGRSRRPGLPRWVVRRRGEGGG